jgi:hypothetical protein
MFRLFGPQMESVFFLLLWMTIISHWCRVKPKIYVLLLMRLYCKVVPINCW